ncbi:hypothetical protein DLEV_099 [Diachasmimorpha longicaudata entomopoxvirus]|uniref:Uncharacterized protein n=1 Tax=Diachasmimorpha longicaudata entomopoxvirus TaxID=109981 RepID=A0A7R5WG41_9POXV|nr:hypothetical protein QKK69_gp099 [Diachasmimorpha longicaudata entomopoxvirus]AKS26390.1 hypothetical protein DLEV_099 [Diachasmimorpha longicaudata entomopoxvirus]
MGLFWADYCSSNDLLLHSIVVYFTRGGKYWVQANDDLIMAIKLENRKEPILEHHVSFKDWITWGELKKLENINDEGLRAIWVSDKSIFLTKRGFESLTANTTDRDGTRHFKSHFFNTLLPTMIDQANIKNLTHQNKVNEFNVKNLQQQLKYAQKSLEIFLKEKSLTDVKDSMCQVDLERRMTELNNLTTEYNGISEAFLKNQKEAAKEYEILEKESHELKVYSHKDFFEHPRRLFPDDDLKMYACQDGDKCLIKIEKI